LMPLAVLVAVAIAGSFCSGSAAQSLNLRDHGGRTGHLAGPILHRWFIKVSRTVTTLDRSLFTHPLFAPDANHGSSPQHSRTVIGSQMPSSSSWGSAQAPSSALRSSAQHVVVSLQLSGSARHIAVAAHQPFSPARSIIAVPPGGFTLVSQGALTGGACAHPGPRRHQLRTLEFQWGAIRYGSHHTSRHGSATHLLQLARGLRIRGNLAGTRPTRVPQALGPEPPVQRPAYDQSNPIRPVRAGHCFLALHGPGGSGGSVRFHNLLGIPLH
jgi:hypothetical protein